jgi:hypothetical protein
MANSPRARARKRASIHVDELDTQAGSAFGGDGEIGALLHDSTRPFSVMTLELEDDGRIRAVFLVNNPAKLAAAKIDAGGV